MKIKLFIATMFLLCASTAFSIDLDPAYRKAFGNGTVIATNGDYPPVGSYNASQFEYKNGEFYINISHNEPVNLRAISPAGKRWKNYYNQTVKEQSANLKYKKEDVFYWQIWTDTDADGKPLDANKYSWPKDVSKVPTWKPIGWFTTKYTGESGEWDTVGINKESFKENAFQFFYNAKPGQKFYMAVSIGYSYIAGAGNFEQKWNPVLSRFESVKSTGELGFSVSKPVCGGTIVVKANKAGN